MYKPELSEREMQEAQERWEIMKELERQQRVLFEQAVERELENRRNMSHQIEKQATLSRNQAKAARKARRKNRK